MNNYGYPRNPDRLKLRVALRMAEVCLVLAATALLVVLAGAVIEVKQAVLDELTDLHRVTLSVGGTAAELRKSAKVAEAASVEQRAYFEGISQRAQAVLDNSARATDALTVLIAHTDVQINKILVPRAASDLADFNTDVLTLTQDAHSTFRNLAATSEATTAAMQQATRMLSDPAIPETVKHLDASSAHLESGMGHLDNSTAMLEAKVRQLTKPAGWAKTVGLAILDAGAKVGQIFAGFVK